MDFIDFCDLVMSKLLEARRSSAQARELGQVLSEVSAAVFDNRSRDLQDVVYGALFELRKVGMVATDPHDLLWRISQVGLETIPNMTALYQNICSQRLELDQEKLLCIVNRLSHNPTPDYAFTNWVAREEITNSGWTDSDPIFSIARELEDLLLIRCDARMGGYIRLCSTYPGLVWEHRRALTLESKFIDALVAEWETTSVEFKQELHLDTASQRAEFIKDILGLTNTQASGARWLIIGFEDKAPEYHGAPDLNVTQDRIEDLLSYYTVPAVDARYKVVEYSAGKVGKLELLRDPKKLPYAVAQSVGDQAAGDKKRIKKGQVFVRHGSRSVSASPEELNDLQLEGERARLTT